MPLLPVSRNGLAIRLVLAATLAVPAAVAASTARALLGWGDGQYGQLGNGHRTDAQSTPVRVRLPRGVTVISVREGRWRL
jgi:alpha-tubulin suppressor-like RCC1 family protein